MAYSVFDSNNKKDHTSVKAFFDDAPTIARYDRQKYPWIEKLTDKQLANIVTGKQIGRAHV